MFSRRWVVIFEGTQSYFKARKLTEATTYYFRVAAVNVSGMGAFSEVLCERTPYTQPPPVEGRFLCFILNKSGLLLHGISSCILAPQTFDISHKACKLRWPALKNLGQDPLIYLVQLTRVPCISAMPSVAANESEDDALTVYRGAETSCCVSNLSPNTNYIVRVRGIRCCQQLQDQNEPQTGYDVRTDDTTSPSSKMVLLNGPLSVGTAFTTLAEKRTPVGLLIDSVWVRPSANTKLHGQHSSNTTQEASQFLSSQVSNFPTILIQRLRSSAALRRLTVSLSATSSSDRAQRRMACILVFSFVLFTLLCAWFANQFLLKFSDDSPAARWPSGRSSLDESSSSARAALYASRGHHSRQHP